MNDKTICETHHTTSHEKYNDFLGDEGGYIGEVWEKGIRCTKCGRKWKDPEDIKREKLIFEYERARSWSCYFGTTNHIIMTLGGRWDHHTNIEEKYNVIRLIKQERYNEDIGLISDKFFVFNKDCQPGHFITEHPEAYWKEWYDEWNLLGNWPGLTNPMHPVAQLVWDKRKIDYQTTKNRIKDRETKWKINPPIYPI